MEQWYREAGITSRKRLGKLWKHESAPSPALALHNGRRREPHIFAMMEAGLIDTEDDIE